MDRLYSSWWRCEVDEGTIGVEGVAAAAEGMK
jgi:hypothetical protein